MAVEYSIHCHSCMILVMYKIISIFHFWPPSLDRIHGDIVLFQLPLSRPAVFTKSVRGERHGSGYSRCHTAVWERIYTGVLHRCARSVEHTPKLIPVKHKTVQKNNSNDKGDRLILEDCVTDQPANYSQESHRRRSNCPVLLLEICSPKIGKISMDFMSVCFTVRSSCCQTDLFWYVRVIN